MLRIDHVQLAIPAGAEDLCRSFYVALLGLREVSKPPALAARGGVWLESPPVRIHLGVEEDFRPARKAHPALVVADLDGLAHRLAEAGCEPLWDEAIPEIRRFYVLDPVGNRIEFMEDVGPSMK
ncbi:VOC family protein [Microvirga sp. Mcv34]|uniref:VOC family protein n=1 Tax=Microvirga sp. Mcv34 TaxID=2926016 RepID=UPI0021C74694|nr:VOC family protein [Microvirga sp. Mcv34]